MEPPDCCFSLQVNLPKHTILEAFCRENSISAITIEKGEGCSKSGKALRCAMPVEGTAEIPPLWHAWRTCQLPYSCTNLSVAVCCHDCSRHLAGGGGADQPTGHCPTQSRAAVGYATLERQNCKTLLLLNCAKQPAGGGGANQPTGHCPTQSRALGLAPPPQPVGPGGGGSGNPGSSGTSSAGGAGGDPIAQYGGGGVSCFSGLSKKFDTSMMRS